MGKPPQYTLSSRSSTAVVKSLQPHEIRRSEPSADYDDAQKAFAELGHDEPLVLDDATNKRLLRRIDLALMPILCIVYMLNYLDKTTLSYASVMGLQKSIGIDDAQYSWLGSIFYFGYLAWEWPTSRLLQRLPLAKYIGFCVFMWGVVLTCFAAVQNFAGAMALRFFLGVFEASVTPGFALITSQWYTKQEQASRTGIWFGFSGLAQVIGGSMGYSLARRNDNREFSLAGWKTIFLILGCVTILFSIVFLLVVPDNQLNCRWLSKRDRALAIERVRVNQQGIGNKTYKIYQFKEALKDPMTWAFVLLALFVDIPNGGVTNFFSLLIKSFGFNAEQSLLLSMPSGVIAAVSVIAWGLFSQRWGYRILSGAFFIAIALIGFIMVLAIPEGAPAGRLVGFYLYSASPAGYVAVLSLVSSNIAGYTKKTSVAAIFLIAYCVGNLIGPQTFRNNDYVPAEITIIVCFALCIVVMVFIHCYYVAQNQKKRELRANPDYVKVDNQEWMDLTDKENPEFTYAF